MDNVADLQKEIENEVGSARSADDLEQLRIRYLGKKGTLTRLMKNLGSLSEDERPKAGKILNEIKERTEHLLERKKGELGGSGAEDPSSGRFFDATLPGIKSPLGNIHPVTRVTEEIVRIFESMGFRREEGPDIETDYYNFEALNIPRNHPARDMQDTFYVAGDLLLRTHTSPVQIRTMERQAPPLAVIVPGKVYRRDADVTHSPMFHQIEGFLVDEGVTFGHLKGVLEEFVHQFYGEGLGVRFRPSFFPFTEPSAELDIECVICAGKGCNVCKKTGWLEILGCGMIDPEVFRYVRYDSERWTGFAFGMGIERNAMLKYGIDDIRLLFENDRRFLKQF
jgi:phenylalanyl-tRNA synthetase alpha chain